jgi:hypothetical protein
MIGRYQVDCEVDDNRSIYASNTPNLSLAGHRLTYAVYLAARSFFIRLVEDVKSLIRRLNILN